MTADLRAAAIATLPEVVALRRRIHRQPELGLKLPLTQAAVLGALDGLGLDITTGTSLSSIVAVLTGVRPGPTILLRADMDALPIAEQTGLDFASEVDGSMHACGHDAHSAMLVGAARVLAGMRQDLAGRVMFLFQPGEEGDGGAQRVLDEGLLDGPDAPRAAFALHVAPTVPSGDLVTRSGPTMASADDFAAEVHGRGGHGAMPHEGLDPVPIACEIVLGLHASVARAVDALDPAVVSVGCISGGDSANSIPETVRFTGTLRTLSEATRAKLQDRLRAVVEGVAAAHGATAHFELSRYGCPVTVNDDQITTLVADEAGAIARDHHWMPTPVMAAEDFAAILQRVPGTMAFLGVQPPSVAQPAPVHSPQMLIDEDALAVGVALHAAVALRLASGEAV